MQPELFHNTLHLTDPELKAAKLKASRKDRQIINFLHSHPAITNFTPLELNQLLESFEGGTWLITSTRRSVNTLTRLKLLIKTHYKRKERYGSYNYVWKVAAPTGKQTSLF